MSWKVWDVLLVGQLTVKRATDFASPSPTNSTRELPPKLPLLPITRKMDRSAPSVPFSSTWILAPIAARLVLVPTSLIFSQWRPLARVLEQGVVRLVARSGTAELDE